MPAKEIKELRQAGKLEEALNLAKAEFDIAVSKWEFIEGVSEENKQSAYNTDLACLWPKRSISWVYYDFLKQNCSYLLSTHNLDQTQLCRLHLHAQAHRRAD